MSGSKFSAVSDRDNDADLLDSSYNQKAYTFSIETHAFFSTW